MSSQRLTRIGLAVALAVVAAVTHGASVSAEHAWNNYHWARTASSFDLTIVNSTTTDWDLYVMQAVGDWSGSAVLNMGEVDGSTSKKDRRKCNSPDGMVVFATIRTDQLVGWGLPAFRLMAATTLRRGIRSSTTRTSTRPTTTLTNGNGVWPVRSSVTTSVSAT
jgi:hypothetical protein